MAKCHSFSSNGLPRFAQLRSLAMTNFLQISQALKTAHKALAMMIFPLNFGILFYKML